MAKKVAAKKTAKKLVKKAPAKKAIKKAIKKLAAKKVVKKAVAKKVVKKVAAKKPVKKVLSKKVAAKKTQLKTKVQVKKGSKVAKKSSIKKANQTKFVAHKTSLKVGDKAPHFEGKEQNGNTVSLRALIGKKVILYFYPKDDTPGCTATACSLRDEHEFLDNNNYAVVGVSADDEKSHAKFAAKYELPFTLIADVDLEIIKAYDVWGTKQMMGKIYDGIIRTTFLIDENGNIAHIIKDVDSANHAQQIRMM